MTRTTSVADDVVDRPIRLLRSIVKQVELDRPSVLLTLAALVAVTAVAPIVHLVDGGRILSQNDLGWHLDHALSFPLLPPEPPAPYFLFHGLVRYLVLAVPPGRADVSAALTIAIFRTATAVAVYTVLRGGLRDRDPAAGRRAALLGTGLLLVVESPRILLVGTAITDGHAFLPLQTMFSPTNQSLIPIAVVTPSVLAWFLRRARADQLTRTVALVTAGVLVLGAIAKPSFVFCVLPILPLWAWALAPGDRWRVAWAAITRLCLPLAVVLALQAWYLAWVLPPDRQGGFAWGPFQVASAWGVDRPVLWLSLVVPAVGVLVAGRLWVMSPTVSVTLAGAAFGIAEFLLLTETGQRRNDGNLGWGAQMCIFVLAVFAVRWLVASDDPRRTNTGLRIGAAWAIVALAVLSGVVAVLSDSVLG